MWDQITCDQAFFKGEGNHPLDDKKGGWILMIAGIRVQVDVLHERWSKFHEITLSVFVSRTSPTSLQLSTRRHFIKSLFTVIKHSQQHSFPEA